MYSKLLSSQSLNMSCRLLMSLRHSSQGIVLSRNLSTLFKSEEHNLAVCYAYRFQNGSNILNPSFLRRHQSTQSASNVTNVADKVNESSTATATSNIVENSVKVTGTENVASGAETSELIAGNNEVLQIPDMPTPVEIVQALSANGEPTFSSLGMCNYSPVGLLQYIFETLHVTWDMPWWATIAMSTCILRLLMFPLVIKTQRNAAAMSEHMPKIQYLTAKMTEARKSNDIYEASLYANELMNYTKKHKFNPLKSMLMPVIQAPVFISMFWGLRQMAEKVPSMKEGGILWFTDLSTYDPYYVLPTITAVTLFITIEVGADSVSAKYMSPVMRNALRALPLVIFPFTMHFEGAILVYWVCNNIFSLGQVSLLKIPAVRTYFEIPLRKSLPPIEAKEKKGFKKGFKETLQNFKIAREMRERENFNEMQFRQAGKGPLIKTYDYNPKVSSTDKKAILTKQRSS